MPPWTGFLDNSGAPCLKLSIGGVFTKPLQEFDVIIDTGFSGFISMPLVKAFPLGLPLCGTTTVTLADGTQSPKLTAIGIAEIGKESKTGVVILEPNSSDILIGMDFLKTFEKVLILHPHKPFVILQDCATIDVLLAKTPQQPTEPQPPPEQPPESKEPDKS